MTKRSYIIILAFLLIFSAVLAVGSTTMLPTANAAVLSKNNFDETEIEDDLSDINLSLYPADINGTIKIVEFVEYCYSDNVFNQGNYGLYLYIYNPQQLAFSMSAGANVINMATAYDDNGKPVAYDNLTLTCLDKTTGDYSNLFYKFKVSGSDKILKTVTEYSKKFGERRYDISDIQLRFLGAGEVETRDYSVGGTWHYTGFAAGYGSDESTLACTKTDLETVRLVPQSTVYRPIVNENGDYVEQTQLNSVYFSVPDRLYDSYGELRKIKAEWDEFETGLIGVFDDQASYDTFNTYVGKKISSDICDSSFVGDYSKPYQVVANGSNGLPVYGYINNAKFAYNTEDLVIHEYGDANSGNKWLDYGESYDLLSAAYFSENALDEVIRGKELLAKFEEYSKEIGGYLINDKYSADLFGVSESEVAEHHILREIDSDAEFDLKTMVLDDNFWFGWMGAQNVTIEEWEDIPAIVEITSEDLAGTSEDIAERLFINEADVADLIAYYTANSIDNRIVLFRFAQSEFMSSKIWSNVSAPNSWTECGYAAKETVYLNFDIISLTFYKEGVYTVIPTVMDPIEIAGDINFPADNGCGDFNMVDILMIILAVLALIMLIPLLPTILMFLVNVIVFIFKGIFFILSLPFKAGKAIAKKIKERKAAKAAKPPKPKTKAKAKAKTKPKPKPKTKITSKPKRRTAAKVKYPKYKVKGYRGKYGKK